MEGLPLEGVKWRKELASFPRLEEAAELRLQMIEATRELRASCLKDDGPKCLSAFRMMGGGWELIPLLEDASVESAADEVLLHPHLLGMKVKRQESS